MSLYQHYCRKTAGCIPNAHRLNSENSEGVYLLTAFIQGYIAKGPKGTYPYQCFSEVLLYLQRFGCGDIDDEKSNAIAKGLEQKPDNFAFLLFAGTIILTQERKQRPPIDNSVARLKIVYSMWKHPLVLIMMARVLGFDHQYNVHLLQESLRIWKGLQKDSLHEIIKYLPNSHEIRNRICYQQEMQWDITREIANCYSALCRKRKKMRYLNGGLSTYQYLMNNFMGNDWDKIRITVRRIRLLFWSGDYHSAYQLVLHLLTFCEIEGIKWDFYSARICYVVFMKLRKYTEWHRAVNQQGRAELRAAPSRNAKDPYKVLLIEDIYRTYLALYGVKMERSFKALYEDIVSRYYKQKESINGQFNRCSLFNHTESFLAFFESKYRNRYKKSLRGPSGLLFRSLQQFHVEKYLRNDGVLNDCAEPLCVGVIVHFTLSMEFAHYKMGYYKLAHYLYQLYHEIDPFDPVAYHQHGLLMQSAGKMERAEKYFKRARKLNIKSKLYLESFGTAEIELNRVSNCIQCGEYGAEYKRCGRCKVQFYCSRKCQKLHWKAGHRDKCVHREDHELTVIDKLYGMIGDLEAFHKHLDKLDAIDGA